MTNIEKPLTCSSLVSPIVHADHSVTFNLYAPDAKRVVLKGSFVPKSFAIPTPAGVVGKEGQYEMDRMGDIWTFTTSSLKSEMYLYHFEVDDQWMVDPANEQVVRDVDKHHSFFLISDGLADVYIEHPVDKGSVEYVWYDSSIQGMPRRRMCIYSPPQYKAFYRQPFPVLYLLHGSGGDEESWCTLGRLPVIMDNMIASGRCKPMIVVMPNGISDRAAAPDVDPYHSDPATAINPESMLGVTEQTFVHDVVDYVESHYYVESDKGHRAIAGLSLGGMHTLFISANHPQFFDYVGLFSAQTTNAMDDEHIAHLEQIATGLEGLTTLLPFLKKSGIGKKVSELAHGVSRGSLSVYERLDKKLERQFHTPPQLYYIAVGKDDFVKKLNDEFRLRLSEGGYPYQYHETDGGHSWENWRKYLVDFLPRLFV